MHVTRLFCPPLNPRRGGASRLFQSPSLRGSGRFAKKIEKVESDAEGFNPLHCGAVVASSARARRRSPRCADRFNPLHCGAVVASRGLCPRSESMGSCFNPLHCGAVVASPRRGRSPTRGGGAFQSPSLRGSGRFPPRSPYGGRGRRSFNPLHCGAVVASSIGRWTSAP